MNLFTLRGPPQAKSGTFQDISGHVAWSGPRILFPTPPFAKRFQSGTKLVDQASQILDCGLVNRKVSCWQSLPFTAIRPVCSELWRDVDRYGIFRVC